MTKTHLFEFDMDGVPEYNFIVFGDFAETPQP